MDAKLGKIGALTPTISREEMAQLPIRRYEGEVRLIESPEELERESAAIRRERVLGFDTETRPAFRKGESYPPALVQLAGEELVWILRLQRLDCSIVLKHVMESDAVKAGIGVADDLRQLRKLFDFEAAAVVDLGALAKRRGVEQTGLRNLAGIVLGFRIPKGKRTSNWAAARLTRQQIGYAALDAWAARALYLELAQ
jgi:ribonuclease D